MGTWMVGYQHPYAGRRRVSPRAMAFLWCYGQAWLWDFYVIYKTRKNRHDERWQGQTLSEFVAALLANPKTRWAVVLGLGWNVAHFISLAKHLRQGTTPGALGMPFKSQRVAREPLSDSAREPLSESARYAMENLGSIGWM